MTLRLYFDEDTRNADLVHALRIRGVDVTTKNTGLLFLDFATLHPGYEACSLQ
jgi:hypothetical protein